MKNKKIIKTILATALAIALTGCSQSKTEEPATITVNCVYADGAPDLVVNLNVDGVSSKPGENGSIIYGYDKDENIIYKMEDSSVKDADGTLNVTSVYEFYSLKYDFDFFMEPLGPENVESIQNISGTIVVRNESGESSRDFTFETVGRRGQTGIWYAGICSCRDGVLEDYIVP